MTCTIGFFSAMMLLFYAGYVTGKEIERRRFEKEIKRGFTIVGNKLYFCDAPFVAGTMHVRNATQEEIDEYVSRM